MYIGDLHIHSRYSRATSRDCTPEYLDLWARKKGIDIVGTGDFTHPAWREELKEKLEPAEDGLYVLKDESHNKGAGRSMRASNPAGAAVRVVEAPGEMGETIFIAKEINCLIGGIDMLDVEENHGGEVKRVRSFSDIAVLYRTHRQAQLLEKCLRQEGIPYMAAGREDFLPDKNVRGTLFFFQYLLCPEDFVSRSLCRKLIWPVEEVVQLSLFNMEWT